MIARELCVNMLIHREYSNPLPARLIITKDAIITENANKPKNIGYIVLNNYTPYPKNPKLANFFKEIGLADELGSGIKKITKYNKLKCSKQVISLVTSYWWDKSTDILWETAEIKPWGKRRYVLLSLCPKR